jgi:hypothetical protein
VYAYGTLLNKNQHIFKLSNFEESPIIKIWFKFDQRKTGP